MSFTQLGWALKKNKFVLTMCEYTLRAFRLNEWCPVFGEHEVKMAASCNVGKDFYVHECFSPKLNLRSDINMKRVQSSGYSRSYLTDFYRGECRIEFKIHD